MENLRKKEAESLIENVRRTSMEFSASITALYVRNAYKCLNVPNFKSLCTSRFQSMSYKSLFEHAKAGEISLSLDLKVGRYSNSAILELRNYTVTQRRSVWNKICERLDDDSPRSKKVTRNLVREVILESKIDCTQAKKSKKSKLDTKEITEAIERQDPKRIAGIFYSMINDLSEINVVIDELNELYDTEFNIEDDECQDIDEDIL